MKREEENRLLIKSKEIEEQKKIEQEKKFFLLQKKKRLENQKIEEDLENNKKQERLKILFEEHKRKEEKKKLEEEEKIQLDQKKQKEDENLLNNRQIKDSIITKRPLENPNQIYQKENNNNSNKKFISNFDKEKRRTVMKLNRNNEYEKFIEFKDGTFQKIEMTNEEKKRFQKPSKNIEVKSKPENLIKSNEIYFLIENENSNPILLNKYVFDNNNYYEDLKKIVDFNNGLKPSNYHALTGL